LVLAVTFLIVPYTLDTLGEDRFGLWVVAFGTIAYLALADLGLCAVTTREIAQGVGRREPPERLREALERSLHWVIWFSLAVLALFAVVDGVWGSQWKPEWVPMREPFAAMVLGYLLVFPLSLFASALTGLGDLGFYWLAVAAQQLLGAAVQILLLKLGYGLWAMVGGFLAGQGTVVVLLVLRLAWKFPACFPRRLPSLFQPGSRPLLAAGAWASVSALGNVVLSGLDVLILGMLIDPAAATVYALTTRLPGTLSRQLHQVIGTLMPSLAEAGAERSPAAMAQTLTTLFLCQAILVGFGAVLVLGVNEVFVKVWVARHDVYGGHGLNSWFVAAMFLRQWQAMTVQMLFSLGFNKLGPLVTLADGAITAGLTGLFVGAFGIVGAPVASALGAILVSLPVNLSSLGRTVGASALALAVPMGEWLLRSLPALGVAVGVAYGSAYANTAWERIGILALGSTAIAVVYGAAMVPMLRRTPLAGLLPGFPRGRRNGSA
jgi:O-antigen/teichoic acid export membrane protein